MKKRPSEKEEVQREAKRERIGNGISSSDVNADADADADADVEEFFALLERIEATDKQFGSLRKINNTTSTPLHANKEAAAWRPSLEWEDFCSHGNGTREVDPGCASASKAREGNSKQGNPVANVNGDNDSEKGRRCVCVDLNLPSTSSSSAELHLFN